MRAFLLFMFFTALPCTAAEEVYVDVDEKGVPTFSDQAGPNSKPVEVNAPVTFESEKLVPVRPEGKQQEPRQQKISYDVRITDPADDSAVRENSGALTLTTKIEPGLAPGHSARLMMDGEMIRGLTSSGPVELSNVDRGTHRFHIEVVDKQGKIIESGPVTRISMLRYHLPPPPRQPPPPPPK